MVRRGFLLANPNFERMRLGYGVGCDCGPAGRHAMFMLPIGHSCGMVVCNGWYHACLARKGSANGLVASCNFHAKRLNMVEPRYAIVFDARVKTPCANGRAHVVELYPGLESSPGRKRALSRPPTFDHHLGRELVWIPDSRNLIK